MKPEREPRTERPGPEETIERGRRTRNIVSEVIITPNDPRCTSSLMLTRYKDRSLEVSIIGDFGGGSVGLSSVRPLEAAIKRVRRVGPRREAKKS